MTEEPIPAPPIHVALASVMADVGAVSKSGRNTQQNFNFRGIDAVVNVVGPVLRDHGVVTLPIVEDVTYESYSTKSGALMRSCHLRIRWRIVGPAGDHLDAVVVAEASDAGDKATAKAHSVNYRTMLLQVLCIPTDEPDPDEFVYERAAPAPRRTVVAAKVALVAMFRAAGYPDETAKEAAAIVWNDGPLADAGRDVEVPDVVWQVLEGDAREAIDAAEDGPDPEADPDPA